MFDEELRRYGKFGVLVAPMLLQVITAPPTDLPDMDKLSEEFQADGPPPDPVSFLKGKAEELYNERVCDVFRDADAYGFLNW